MVEEVVLVVGVVLVSGVVLLGELTVVLDGEGVSLVVLDCVGPFGVVLEGVVVTPVPATCRLGMTPSGMTSARMVAKPKRKPSIITVRLGCRRTI